MLEPEQGLTFAQCNIQNFANMSYLFRQHEVLVGGELDLVGGKLDLVGGEIDQVQSKWGRTRHGTKPV